MIHHECHKVKIIASPCVSNCCLDAGDICIGCFRHIDEIVAWRSYSSDEQQAVIVLCQQRKQNLD